MKKPKDEKRKVIKTNRLQEDELEVETRTSLLLEDKRRTKILGKDKKRTKQGLEDAIFKIKGKLVFKKKFIKGFDF